MATIEKLRQALINAEDTGKVCKVTSGEYSDPRICWIVGDFIIVYVTDDEDFNATMLTEDMMDDLIIEVR
jgi:mRNA-degrading endonuclease YafQ of YafQ-DinJ toxin-antitoxin module